MNDPVALTITAEIPRRWVPCFLGLLETMQYCGDVGTSRQVTIFADGDGDFQPKFTWLGALDIEPAKGAETQEGWLFDAG